MTRGPDVPRHERRYLAQGHVAHALTYGVPGPSVCGIWGDDWEWFGTGTQAEHEKAAAFSRCRNCVRRVGEDW